MQLRRGSNFGSCNLAESVYTEEATLFRQKRTLAGRITTSQKVIRIFGLIRKITEFVDSAVYLVWRRSFMNAKVEFEWHPDL